MRLGAGREKSQNESFRLFDNSTAMIFPSPILLSFYQDWSSLMRSYSVGLWKVLMRGENSFSSLNTHQRTRLTASRASSASSFTMLSFNEPAFLPYEPIPHEELLRILNSDAQSGFPRAAAVDFSFEGFQAFDDLPPPLPFRPLPIPLRSLAGPSLTGETSYPSTEIGESSTGSSPNEFGGRRGEQERSWLNLRASTSRKEYMFAISLVIKCIRLPSL